MFKELKVVTVYNDENQFENDVNGWCCNSGYSIISCNVLTVQDERGIHFMYTAFLGK